MSKPKIVVLHMRELIYTAIFAVLIFTLLILLFFMFRPKDKKATTEMPTEKESSTLDETSAVKYTPGIYTSSVTIADHCADIEVAVDSDKINHIRLVNLGESVTTAYPLIEPSLDGLSEQICQTQSLDGITCSRENKYTSEMLFQAIKSSLAKARR